MIWTVVGSDLKRTMTSNHSGWIVGWAGLLLVSGLVSFYLQRPAELPSVPNATEVAQLPQPDIPQVMMSFEDESVPDAVETIYLEVVLSQGDYSDKQSAIHELKRVATPDAVQVLTYGLRDDDARVRTAALEALASLGVDEATAAIASLSGDEDYRVRADATLSLAMAGGPSATEYLKLAIHDPNPIVRMAAINSLSDMGDDYSVSVIQKALLDPDEMVRERALEVIDEINEDAAFRALYPPLPD